MSFKEETISSKSIYKGKVLQLNVDKVKLEDGSQSFREEIIHSGGVGVLCVKDNKVLLVKQFRYSYKKELLEIPAGKLEFGENPYDAGLRELREETGIVANKLHLINTLYPTPGYTNEIIYLYFCNDILKEEKQSLDIGEFVDCAWFDLQDIYLKIKNNELHDAKTIYSILAYKGFINGK